MIVTSRRPGLRPLRSARLAAALAAALLLPASALAGAAGPSPSHFATACTTLLPTADAQAFFLDRGFTDRGTTDGVWTADYEGSPESAAPVRPPFMTVSIRGHRLVQALDLEATIGSDGASELGQWSLDDLAFALDTWFAAGDTLAFERAASSPLDVRRDFPHWPTTIRGGGDRYDREFVWEMTMDDAGMHLLVRIRPAMAGASWFGDWFEKGETPPPPGTACHETYPLGS